VIRRAVALSDAEVLTADDLRMAPVTRRGATAGFDTGLPFPEYKQALLDHYERLYLDDVMTAARGNVSEAARRSGLSRQHLFNMLKRHGLRGSGES